MKKVFQCKSAQTNDPFAPLFKLSFRCPVDGSSFSVLFGDGIFYRKPNFLEIN